MRNLKTAAYKRPSGKKLNLRLKLSKNTAIPTNQGFLLSTTNKAFLPKYHCPQVLILRKSLSLPLRQFLEEGHFGQRQLVKSPHDYRQRQSTILEVVAFA